MYWLCIHDIATRQTSELRNDKALQQARTSDTKIHPASERIQGSERKPRRRGIPAETQEAKLESRKCPWLRQWQSFIALSRNRISKGGTKGPSSFRSRPRTVGLLQRDHATTRFVACRHCQCAPRRGGVGAYGYFAHSEGASLRPERAAQPSCACAASQSRFARHAEEQGNGGPRRGARRNERPCADRDCSRQRVWPRRRGERVRSRHSRRGRWPSDPRRRAARRAKRRQRQTRAPHP